MKHIGRIILAGVLFCSFSAAADAQQAAYEQENADNQPLIIIRFNQPHLAYERPLYTTLTRALQVKPAATFNVVSVAPRADNPDNQRRYSQMASQNTRHVMNSLREMGLPQNRITLTNMADTVSASEVRIYVH